MNEKILKLARHGKRFDGELIIDSHCHVGHAMPTITHGDSISAIQGTLERIGIDEACICTRGAGVVGDPFLGNDRTAEYVKRVPRMFRGYVTIAANYGNFVEEIKRGEAMGLTLGIKMHSYRQPHDLNEGRFRDMLEYLDSRGMILLHHYFGRPERLEQLLKTYRNIKFLEGHCIFDYARLTRKYDNMYINTCAEIGFDNIRRITEAAGADNIIYGSDLSALDATFSLGAVAYAKISDEEKRKILGLNMKRLIEG